MTTMRLYKIWLWGVLTVGIAWQVSEAKRNKDQEDATEKLASAARSCDMPTLKALVASSVNVSAKSADGHDALSLASLNRKEKYSAGKRERWTLKCPAAVVALTEAGADPWKSDFYQNPRLDGNRPEMIAVISVEDNREKKADSEKIIDEMTSAIEIQLHGSPRSSHLGYPILGLEEVKQKLRTSGFSAEDTMAPDRVKACKTLAVDSVFEASLEDFRTKNIGVIWDTTGMTMKFSLTDCQTGELLWRSDEYYALFRGLLLKAFGNKVKQIITGFVDGRPAVAFPDYDEKGKK